MSYLFDELDARLIECFDFSSDSIVVCVNTITRALRFRKESYLDMKRNLFVEPDDQGSFAVLSHPDLQSDEFSLILFLTDMDEVRRRHKIRSTLNHSEISLGEVTASRTVLIRNLPVDISRDVLELYFSNRRRSDGGEVREVSIDVEQKQALVTFVDVEGRKKAN